MSEMALFSLDADSNVIWSLANIDRVISGPEVALQRVAHALFTKQGTIVWSRQDGGSMREAMIGPSINNLSESRANAMIAVNRAFETIRRNQSRETPLNETVVRLELSDVSIDSSTQTTKVKIRIVLADGNSFVANFNG